MKEFTLKTSDLSRISIIQNNLSNNKLLSVADTRFLVDFLGQLPNENELLDSKFPLDSPIDIQIMNINAIKPQLKKWRVLFNNIPGFDFVGCYTFELLDEELLKKGVVLNVVFAPSMSYNVIDGNAGYEIYLMDNGSAEFKLPKVVDAKAYPELYNFKGTWREAYYLLIETLKKGWPMDEFPKELQQFLKKE